ncbi:restriction endonuclease subunit S [Sphingobacterium thalpophilum]|uniref:restriction endonuclease subunit S n=1 Tax=Sphingobacterium thalpophilum TaxID=259 RepID=UPI0031E2FA4D
MEKLLPKGWVETSLLKISNVFTGKKDANHGTVDGRYPFFTCAFEPLKSPDFSYDSEVMLLPGNGANVGEVFYYKGKFQAYQRTYIVDNIEINHRYLFYHLKHNWKIRNANQQYGSATNYIKIGNFNDYSVEFPPLPEQERIVAKLDKLFAQHEKIKKALDRIPQLLKAFRQQVLTQAVTGKLTEQWREGKDLEEWKNEKAQDCCLKVQSGGTPKGSKFTSSGIPFLKVYNIVNNKIDFDSEPQYVSEEIHTTQIKKSIAYPGDVIMNIVGPPLNKIAMLTNQYPEWNLNQAITIFRVKDYLNNKFLYYFFCEGTSVRSLGHDLRGVVGQANISLSQCRNFDIPIPSLQEQREIVRRVESLFAKADTIEARYLTLKAKIDSLPQSILHKAFKGELVPQLPTDGDAKDLLAEIMALKEEVKGRK